MKGTANKILATLLAIALLVFITYQITENKKKQKEVEIERKLELVDWNDLSDNFATKCVDILNEVDGLQPFLSTKKVFTDKEMKGLDLDDYDNHPLSVEYVCELLGESDAITESFSEELLRIESVYDPSDYETPMDEKRRLSK
mgnify:CR=1 FL=1